MRWFERLLVAGVRPWPAAVGGTVAAALIGLAIAAVGDDLATATQALILVVPVVGAAVLGGRKPAYIVAAATTVVFSLGVPPVGSLRVLLADDLIALVVFSAVALVIGTLVATRIEILGRVERQRAVLLRSVSHDLRTPLASIRGATTELLDIDHAPETRDKLLGLISDEAERLDRLVANLLSLGRIEAGALTPRRQPVDVGELIDVSTRRLERLLADRPLTLDVPANLPLLDADYTLLDQVVTNLLENAARHTPPGTAVTISAAAQHDRLTITVADTGPGVDPAKAHTGVGLTICRAIVDAHGGTIEVDNTQGARFTVTLPC